MEPREPEREERERLDLLQTKHFSFSTSSCGGSICGINKAKSVVVQLQQQVGTTTFTHAGVAAAAATSH